MGVDPERGAGDEGQEVLAGLHEEALRVLRLDNERLAHAVGDHLAVDLDGEGVADVDAVEVGEELGRGEAAVSGEHRVGGGAADRQGGALQVADAALEDGVARAVEDRQVHVDGGDPDPGHQSLGVAAQEGGVALAVGDLLVVGEGRRSFAATAAPPPLRLWL